MTPVRIIVLNQEPRPEGGQLSRSKDHRVSGKFARSCAFVP